jgi:outer membrane protein OmpA-like peptidoglycan-associated protein
VAITDFGSSARNLSTAARGQLDSFAADKDIAGCELKVVGYASSDGRASVNQRVSAARAEAVAAYLKDKGFAKVTAEGAGETQQFGVGAANRRVVVTVVKP